jgi:hypothetical protein
MRWRSRSALLDTSAVSADDKPSSELRAVQMALSLWRMVGLVTSDEFHRQEDRYDYDSGQGRELLFLIANHEWIRATSEVINIGRSDAIETALKIDVDLRRITHEAFHGRTGRLWLPVTVLPLQAVPGQHEPGPFQAVQGHHRPDPFQAVQGHHEPDPFATVTDAAENLLPLMPADDLRHQMSAGMADIIVNMATGHLPGRARDSVRADPGQGRPARIRVATRDDRVLLSAAIHRLLRRGSNPSAGTADRQHITNEREHITNEFAEFAGSLPSILARPGPDAARFRIAVAGYRLRALLAIYITYLGLYAGIAAAETVASELKLPESQFAPKLAYRAVRVFQALAASTVIAVPLDIDSAPTVLTVRVPARRLNLTSRPAKLWNPRTWLISPSGHLQIDVLLPTADADRQIQVQLADGISFDESPRAGRLDGGVMAPRLDIAVRNPSPVEDLSASMEEVLRVEEEFRWPRSLSQSLVDLALAKAALVSDALRHYEVRAEDGPASSSQDGQTLTDRSRESLKELGEKLPSVTNDAASVVRLRAFWQRSGLDRLHLFRRASVDTAGPRALVARAEMIEDVTQRATPEKAVIHADVRVADREYFSITRTSARMSLIVMTGILIALIGWHIISPKTESSLHPEVLAIVLTLFATIQAGRIERPDRSTLQGQLSSSGTGMLAASMLPPVALAIGLAFQPAVLAASIWAAVCIAVQAIFLILMRWWWGPPTVGGEHGDRKRARFTLGDRRRFETGPPTVGGEHGDRKRARFTLGDRRRFETEPLEYDHFEVLRSDYWRNTTADALTLGRMAYGYMIRHGTDKRVPAGKQVPPQLESLLMPAGPAAAAEKKEPRSALALLHSSTQQQAITFAVFREKCDDLLAASREKGPGPSGTRVYEAEEFDLNPDRLTPMDAVSSQVDVFIGQHGDFPVIEKHPLVTALEAARGRLIVLEAQLPFPPPVLRYPGWQWARMRLALRDADDIRRLTEFLHQIYLRIVRSEDAYVVAVQADLTVLPRAIDEFVTPPPGGEGTGLGEDAGDLYLPDGSPILGENPGAAIWRMVSSCAPARSNIESDIIERLPFDKSRFQLAHLNYGLLHGMAVVIILLHDANHGAENSPVSRPVQDGQRERGLDPDVAYWSHPAIPVNATVSRRELGPLVKCPLLHIRFHWDDRPSAFLDVLKSIDAVLDNDPPAIHRASRSVSYARLYIATGRIAEGDLTVRIHPSAQRNAHANRLITEQLARKITAAAALEASSRRDSRVPVRYLDGRQDPVIRIDLLGKALSGPKSVPEHGRHRGAATTTSASAAPPADHEGQAR